MFNNHSLANPMIGPHGLLGGIVDKILVIEEVQLILFSRIAVFCQLVL